jgi:hypothetical protein
MGLCRLEYVSWITPAHTAIFQKQGTPLRIFILKMRQNRPLQVASADGGIDLSGTNLEVRLK